MRWFKAGLFYEDGELRPGSAPGTDAGPMQLLPGIDRAHAYDTVAKTVLIGMSSAAPSNSWVEISYDEAVQIFTSVVGWAPNDKEVPRA